MSSSDIYRIRGRALASPWLAIGAALALRLSLIWLLHRGEDPAHPRLDTVGLEARLIAHALAAGQGFANPYPYYHALTATLAPVYPFLWSIGIRLLHLGDYGATVFTQVMNCLFSAATCWPIFSIARKLFGRNVGLGSAWLWAVLPYSVLFPLEWTWDQSLSALTLALIVAATFCLRNARNSLVFTAYALLWAFAALVNRTLCILLPFFLGWMMLPRNVRTADSSGIGFRSAAQVVVIFVLALLPWTIRNYYALDGFVLVKSNFGLELWLGNNPGVKEIYTPELHPLINRSELISLILNGEPNYNRQKTREALAFIESHPRAFMKNLTTRLIDTWAATYDPGEDWINVFHLARLNVWFCTAFSLLSFAGLIVALRTDLRATAPLAICVIIFPIPYYITHTSLRYRHPIDPFLAILSAYAGWRLLRLRAFRREAKAAIVHAPASPPAEPEFATSRDLS